MKYLLSLIVVVAALCISAPAAKAQVVFGYDFVNHRWYQVEEEYEPYPWYGYAYPYYVPRYREHGDRDFNYGRHHRERREDHVDHGHNFGGHREGSHHPHRR